eukprot:m.125697 g.125697  ORF g.125697 m.125697 type:complete len:359 (+) comp15626_c6_seq2:160-1236(+)
MSSGKRKAAAETLQSSKKALTNVNADICQFLNELAEHEKNVTRHIHKHNAYRKASRAIAAHPARITSGKDAQALPGVGQKIGTKIDEFLTTGKLKKLEAIQADPTAQAIQLIAGVVGFGPAAARKYVDQGITTLEELEKQPDLTATQRIGLKYYKDLEERIPREEVDCLKEQAFAIIHKVDPQLTAEVCGSYRRGASSSGDIDILMTHPEFTSDQKDSKGKITTPRFANLLTKIVTAMEKAKFVTASLSCGQTKFMGVCCAQSTTLSAADSTVAKKHRRIDIRFWPADQYPLALLYFTGSDELNKEMRRKAIEMNFHLNEYMIRPMGEKGQMGEALPVTCEKDVFDYLDMKYLEPFER